MTIGYPRRQRWGKRTSPQVRLRAARGDNQSIPTSAQETRQDGRLQAERTRTGTRTGDFDVTDTVVLPMVCSLGGQTVHVEGKPSGSVALGGWWVYVKSPGGKPFKLWLDAKEKPALQACNWIVINACGEDEEGDPIAPLGEIKMGDRLPDVPGAAPATLLLKYLEGGAMILKGLADSKIAYRASKVTFTLNIETITCTGSKWTVEVCRNGK